MLEVILFRGGELLGQVGEVLVDLIAQRNEFPAKAGDSLGHGDA